MYRLVKTLVILLAASVIDQLFEANIIRFSAEARLQDLYSGASCVTRAGSMGTCKDIQECRSAAGDIAEGRAPNICSFSGNIPIVCCPVDSDPANRNYSIEVESSKSYQNCERYGKLVTIQVPVNSLARIPVYKNKTLCNMDRANTLVSHGKKCRPGEFPHMALLGFSIKGKTEWSCGGSLISERFVLTAGHCLFTRGSNVSYVLLGDTNITDTRDSRHVQQVEVAEIIPHPDYHPPAKYNDIALLKLKHDVRFTEFVRPACIHKIDTPGYESLVATVTGWGSTETGMQSDHLLKADLNIVGIKECRPRYETERKKRLKDGVNGDTMVCAGDPGGKKDACQGDSGGPLQMILMKPFCLYGIIGVTSFGPTACGNGGAPGVYTRVSHFIPWIESIVWPDT